MDIQLTVQPTEDHLSLSDFLAAMDIPRKTRHFLRMRKHVEINGQSLPFHTPVKTGDQVTLHIQQDDYPKHHVLRGDKTLVDVLYEDEHLIIVNKPCHMKTHPNQPQEKDTLLNHVAAYLDSDPYVVHRLDMETSGCILFAKNPVILPLLGRMLERKDIKRYYEAIARGHLTEPYLVIDQPIDRDKKDKRKRCVDQKGKKAITRVTVLDETATDTRIMCELDTGRTHQIRVHLAAIGHPLKGDPLYHPDDQPRLYLHAYELVLKHPLTQQTIVAHSDTPF